MSDVTVTPLSPADAAGMEALYVLSVRANPQGFIQDLEYHGSMVAFADHVTAAGGVMLVMKDAERVIGMGALRPAGEAGQVEMCKLHLHPDYQGRGLGRMLCEGLLAAAKERGFTDVALHVTTSQMPAIGLYRKQGFTEGTTEVWRGEYKGQPLIYETLHMHKPL